MSGERCDVAVVGAGLVGLCLAYELACLGASVTVVEADRPGRATDAGAGILSPLTSAETDPALWPFLRQAGDHYPALLARMATDGAVVDETGYGRCGILSIGLRETEDEWFAPFAELVLRRAPDEVAEITPEEASSLFPPLTPVHRVLHAPASARIDGRGMAAALRQAAAAHGVAFVTGAAHGVTAGADGGRHVESVEVEGHGNVMCDAVAVAGGAWTAAVGEWLGTRLPVGPTKGQIVHLGVEAETSEWPIVQPLLTHYLVSWPGGRVACGGTFEAAAGYSTDVTAAGLHELLRECLTIAPGLHGASYLETRVGLRPTSADDRAIVGRVPGWGNAWVATGHGANGLLQGPFSARGLAHTMAGVDLPADEAPLPASFGPGRFA
ncbi:MAG TPA: FAD-dependent oxidoreductase [Acidimicrobiales bacterium]|jgi:D-amino-acid dehydrogenase|nr:FAD-dependent oxidoreductase [Acidimicrobiales bacterium]